MKIILSIVVITFSIAASAQSKKSNISKSVPTGKDSSNVYTLNADGSITGYNKLNGKIVNPKLPSNPDNMPIAKVDSTIKYRLKVIDTDTAKISH